MVMNGQLIVLEGTDGSGKSTQFQMLMNACEKQHIPYFSMKFPQYTRGSSYFVKQMLEGNYGTLAEQSPYRSTLFYLLDQFDAMAEIKKHLSLGELVILDRYATSNIGHQGGKISDSEERMNYLHWFEDIAYEKCALLKPDKVFFLHMPEDVSWQLLQNRSDKKDIHETDVVYQTQVRLAYIDACKTSPHWEAIEVTKNGMLRSAEDIHRELFQKVLLLVRK